MAHKNQQISKSINCFGDGIMSCAHSWGWDGVSRPKAVELSPTTGTEPIINFVWPVWVVRTLLGLITRWGGGGGQKVKQQTVSCVQTTLK